MTGNKKMQSRSTLSFLTLEESEEIGLTKWNGQRVQVKRISFSSSFRVLGGFTHFIPRLSALCSWSSKIQPHWKGDLIHPEEQWRPDHLACTAGRAGVF